MKRKKIIIGIMFLAVSVVTNGLLVNNDAWANDNWCDATFSFNDNAELREKKIKYCTHQIMANHKTAVDGKCSKTTESACKDFIKEHVTLLQGAGSKGDAEDLDSIGKAIKDYILAGESVYDPCKGITYQSALSSCRYSNRAWYEKPAEPSGTGYHDDDQQKEDKTDYGGGNCTSLLDSKYCDRSGGDGIMDLIRFVIGILTGAVIVAGTIGIIVCGVMIVTARDDEQQLSKAKKRLLDIVIGIIAWAMIAVILNLFIPKTADDIDNDVNKEKTSMINGGRG